ncbi:FHA domain-containing protein [Actinophytocola sediminis]
MTLHVTKSSKVGLLPKEIGSLAATVPPAAPGTLFVLGRGGGMSVAPDADFPIVFGRNEPDVHVCVGAGDQHVSRQHGTITRQYGSWLLHNLGRLPIRLPGGRLVLNGDLAELPAGYTPLFIVAPEQEHLLEVRIAAHRRPTPPPGLSEETRTRTVWTLSEGERLVLVCLGQRYLGGDPMPQPLTWEQVAEELREVDPAGKWTWRKAAHIVATVRKRLSTSVPGLLEHEIPPPVGNALNHNLIMELVITTTIGRGDLALLGP